MNYPRFGGVKKIAAHEWDTSGRNPKRKRRVCMCCDGIAHHQVEIHAGHMPYDDVKIEVCEKHLRMAEEHPEQLLADHQERIAQRSPTKRKG